MDGKISKIPATREALIGKINGVIEQPKPGRASDLDAAVIVDYGLAAPLGVRGPYFGVGSLESLKILSDKRRM
jgi:hypothetical protein